MAKVKFLPVCRATGKVLFYAQSRKCGAEKIANKNAIEPGVERCVDGSELAYCVGQCYDSLKHGDKGIEDGAVSTLGNDITFSFPAVKGYQSARPFYTAQVPLKHFVSLFKLTDERLRPEQRAQRVVNQSHAKEITTYILENRSHYVLPAVVVSCDSKMAFEDLGDTNVGMLKIPITAKMLINDGQHRRAAIEMALSQDETLANETIGVTLYEDRGLAASQQMFTDINANAKKVSTNLNALYDHRCAFNQLCADLIKALDWGHLIEYEKSSVNRKSDKLWTISGFKKFVSLASGLTAKNMRDEHHALYLNVLAGALPMAIKNIPRLQNILSGEERASQLRRSHIIAQQVFIEALGMTLGQLGFNLHSRNAEGLKSLLDMPIDVEAQLANLQYLNYSIDVPESAYWQGRCLLGERFQKSTVAVKSTAEVMMLQCDIALPRSVSDLEHEGRAFTQVLPDALQIA